MIKRFLKIASNFDFKFKDIVDNENIDIKEKIYALLLSPENKNFLEFCTEHYIYENVQFVLVMDYLLKSDNVETKKSIIHHIHFMYLQNDSMFELNVSNNIKNNVSVMIKNYKDNADQLEIIYIDILSHIKLLLKEPISRYISKQY